MLSKKFKSNKYYEVTRFYFKYGNEWDEMENTITVWDTYEKAMTYIERYATGLKFAKAYIKEVVVDRDITSSDYKNNRYNKIASQKIYLKNRTGVCKEPIEPIYFYTEPIYKNKTDKQTEEKVEPAEVFEIEDIRDGSVKTFDDLHDAYLNAWENANISEVWTYYKLYKRNGSKREFLKAVYPCTIVCGYEVVGATAGHGFFKTLQEAKDFLKEKGEKHPTTINKIVKEAPTDDSFIFAVDVYEPVKEEKEIIEPEENNEDEGANIIKKTLVAEARKHKARDKPPDKFKSIGA